jgi:hypothetical protein
MLHGNSGVPAFYCAQQVSDAALDSYVKTTARQLGSLYVWSSDNSYTSYFEGSGLPVNLPRLPDLTLA